MKSIVGFTIFSHLPDDRIKALEAAQDRALSHFALQRRSVTLGGTRLELWGRESMQERIHTLPDGSVAAVIGSPHGRVSLTDVQEDLLAGKLEIPWDGRVIVLHISPDGKRWTMWNDWLGSIPVFHAPVGHGRVVSTLEPVTVSAAGYTPDDFHLPGLLSLLVYGHFISDWTLYRGMKVIPPDSAMQWDEGGFRSNCLWTVQPGQDRWETSWDDLVDEMHALAYRAVADVLANGSNWILPLSAGLDSRLIAAIGADLGVDFHAYSWGEPETTDVIYSHQVAKTLRIPWKRIDLCENFLESYTPLWADLFGSSMHFHGMYQICFLENLRSEPGTSLLSGYIGDQLSGINGIRCDAGYDIYKNKWYVHWDDKEVRSLLKVPLDDAFQEITDEVERQKEALRGTRFFRDLFFGSWSRQRLFTSFQSTLTSYWRNIATPFMNRAYAQFCMSLPRAILENRRLLADVFRRYYGRLAVIPGTYASEPFILTGRYLLRHRIVNHLPAPLHHGPFAGFDDVPLRMDIDCVQASGRDALWPLFDAWDQLSEWLDVDQLELAYQKIMQSREDIRPLRKLQSVQALAYRLIDREKMTQ